MWLVSPTLAWGAGRHGKRGGYVAAAATKPSTWRCSSGSRRTCVPESTTPSVSTVPSMHRVLSQPQWNLRLAERASRSGDSPRKGLPKRQNLAYNIAILSQSCGLIRRPIRPRRRRFHESPSYEVCRSSPYHFLCAFHVGGRRDSKNCLEERHRRAPPPPRHTQAPTHRFD